MEIASPAATATEFALSFPGMGPTLDIAALFRSLAALFFSTTNSTMKSNASRAKIVTVAMIIFRLLLDALLKDGWLSWKTRSSFDTEVAAILKFCFLRLPTYLLQWSPWHNVFQRLPIISDSTCLHLKYYIACHTYNVTPMVQLSTLYSLYATMATN